MSTQGAVARCVGVSPEAAPEGEDALAALLDAGASADEPDGSPFGVCPTTQETFQDPVVAADGHTYERTAIERWFAERNRTSPLTGARLPSTALLPNHAERSRIRNAA